MADRETVIKGLECCSAPGRNCDMRCPYYDEDECEARLERDAIILLKEQEAKPVKVVKNAYNHEFYYCPKCDRSFYETWLKKPKFCDECGQEVKWE